MSEKQKIFICGGGTGGHFFSGVALAEAFLKLHPDFEINFVGTRNGIEGRTTLSDPRMKILFISAKGLKGKSGLNKILGLVYLALGVFQSIGLLLRNRPRIVFGVGGYASAPTLLAAWLLQILGRWKVAVLEQNSMPGMANRLFVKLGIRAYSGFEFPGFQLVNLPLRASSLEKAQNLRKPVWPPKVVFILGGSQGARGLNSKWRELFPKLRSEMGDVEIIHQTGKEDEVTMKEFYQSQSVRAEVFAFSNEMPKFYERSDLLICRSGAMTVFEIMAFQRPCIFVPFPAAADDHQRKNALAVQKAEWVVDEKDFNSDRVLALLKSLQPSIPSRDAQSLAGWENIFRDLLQ